MSPWTPNNNNCHHDPRAKLSIVISTGVIPTSVTQSKHEARSRKREKGPAWSSASSVTPVWKFRQAASGWSSILGSTNRPTGRLGGTAPPPQFTDDIFGADYVYLTHWHFDHFDPRDVRKFSKATTVIVPKFPISGLPAQLKDIGFERIVELNHGQKIEFGDNFALTSYQITFQDDQRRGDRRQRATISISTIQSRCPQRGVASARSTQK